MRTFTRLRLAQGLAVTALAKTVKAWMCSYTPKEEWHTIRCSITLN